MLKCGQKDNANYTFGIRKEQVSEVEKEAMVTMYCASCSKAYKSGANFCQHCGEPLK